ncbi:PREDICTED: defensin-like [Ceratosolen solmsi marchali]|uniref:Defensin-like n=1 Tax=Ceratosolen solmsi marchali TaxID=326594 RepID=A0AAJ7DZA8_9HYME|nr:PREDICTED: defensin-like [Ceratosolen solmsi marchali]
MLLNFVKVVPLKYKMYNDIKNTSPFQNKKNYQQLTDEYLVRLPRVTYNLLSFGNWTNVSVCAAHCLTLKKAGGSCKHGMCHCRK